MSATIPRQTSFESPLQRRLSEDQLEMLQNRSFSVRAASDRYAPGLLPEEPTSPLKRFARAKLDISKAFSHVRERLGDTRVFLEQVYGKTEVSPVSSLLERCTKIDDVLSRDHMKVAFFGRTSNGKSTVINALLHGKVLPAGIGHTTNCFCSVIGHDSPDGYLLKPGSEEKHSVKDAQQLLHSLHKDRLDESSLVKVYWPKERCALLNDGVEFMDSPGIDMNPNMDEWITKHCMDADVFVLVSNAESTLMTAEKSFFHHVGERVSKPNIFILNNRWDASAQEPEMMEEVRQQHLSTDLAFLTEELRVADEKIARDRVFFISAKEVLDMRLRERQNDPDPGRGLAEGYGQRRMEFERFEAKFKACVSDAAIRTKFEHHYRQGVDVVGKLKELVASEEEKIRENSKVLDSDLEYSTERQKRLELGKSSAYESCKEKIDGISTSVEKRVTVAMGDVVSQLPALFDTCGAEFRPEQVETFKGALFEHMDQCLEREIGRISTNLLAPLYLECQMEVQGTYQNLLALPQEEINKYTQLAGMPDLNYRLRCSDLCVDFKEDLDFHFSFGITSLMGYANRGAWLVSVRNSVANVLTMIPGDYLVPIAILATGMLVTKLFSWKILVPSFALYGGLYCYERFTFTDRTKKAQLKKQFVQHIKGKIQDQVRATTTSFSSILTSPLRGLTHHLQSVLASANEAENTKILKLREEKDRHLKLLNQAKNLQSAVRFVQTDLEDFHETYLQQES
eukprot:Em0008g1018a